MDGELTEDQIILMANCGECWAEPGVMCAGGQFHQLRIERASRKLGGLLDALIRS